MSIKKRLLDNERVRGWLVGMAAAYMRFVYRTSRWEVRNGDIPQGYWDRGEPFILGFWHGRLLMPCFAWDKRHPMHVLISRHRDGELITHTMGQFGIGTVRGSSKEGEGAQALREIVRLLRNGAYVAISPDGPRGPRMRGSEGIVSAARLAGVPVIPMAVGTSRRRLLNSWDRFLLPLPFARGVFVWGEPIVVPRNSDRAACAAAQLQIEAAITATTDTADRLTGHAPVEPDPLPAGRAAGAAR
ncbi:MAG: DUF374 domain-containing protein [Alphaproteobacteria bacterium]|nr:DUF374 domain-containing protein [Alphaproteobacteria bacterium]